MATETENKPVVAGEEEKKVEAPAVEAAAAAAPAAADKPAEAAAAAGGGDTAADKKPEEKADAAPAAGGEGGDGATSSDAAAAPAKKEKEMKPTVHKANFEKDVVYLYQFTRTPMLPSISPFCLKVETWLRLAGLKYEVSGVPALSSPILHLKKRYVCVYVCASQSNHLTRRHRKHGAQPANATDAVLLHPETNCCWWDTLWARAEAAVWSPVRGFGMGRMEEEMLEHTESTPREQCTKRADEAYTARAN